MIKLLVLIGSLPLLSCLFFSPGTGSPHDGPYIDSIGFAAALARIEAVQQESSGTLISQALAVQDDSLPAAQSSFFSSIEESYQRYLPLFSPVRRSKLPTVRCVYNLVETFKQRQIDPLPFVNALLHRMSLTDLTTADFKMEPEDDGSILLYVTYTRIQELEENGKMSVSESDLILSLHGHYAMLVTALN